MAIGGDTLTAMNASLPNKLLENKPSTSVAISGASAVNVTLTSVSR